MVSSGCNFRDVSQTSTFFLHRVVPALQFRREETQENMKSPVLLVAESTILNVPLPPKFAPAAAHPQRRSLLRWLEAKTYAWLPAISFAFMIYSSVNAVYQTKGDPTTVAFVVGSLSILGGLYVCIHEIEKAVAKRDEVKQERLKLAIWLLAMSLNTLFSYRVTSVVNSPIFSVVVWSLAGVTTVVGFYLIFFSAKARHGDGTGSPATHKPAGN